MSSNISLHDLVNLSIGTPERGAVNFNALHTLLHAICGHLKIANVTTEWTEEDRDRGPGSIPSPMILTSEKSIHGMEDKLRHIERQISALESLPTGTDLLSRTAAGTTPVNDMWQLMQLHRKVQSNEDGVSKTMALIQDLLQEINELRECKDRLKAEISELQNQLSQLNLSELADRITALEPYCHQVEDLEAATRELQGRVAQYPHPDELTQYVTWEVLQVTLVSERQKLQKELRDTVASVTPSAVAMHAGHAHDSSLVTASEAPSTDDGPAPGAEADAATGASSSDGEFRRPLSRISSGAERYPEALQALRDVGSLTEKHGKLEARVELLEAGKADQTQLQQLRDLLTNLGEKDMPDNLLEQFSHLRDQMDSMVADKEKLDKLRSMMEGIMRSSSSLLLYSLLQDHLGQNSELLSDVQGAILQLQAEYEKLHSTTNQLMVEHSQRQSHIDHLCKSLEELDEKKADKELVEMEIEIKADKRALESKVSRLQFDNMTEQLNGMFQELLSKISVQEQDWHKVIEKISTEMESKLNRIELDSLKKQLEDRWKAIRKQLQAQPAPELDDAAGIRKQLVARFHCISCDRPVDMLTPGPHLVTVPSAPGLPCHKSSRPYTVYELEQVRQHYRRCLQRECAMASLSSRNVYHYSERIPEMSDYTYLAMSRSCGGSHTLTHPNRRGTRLQTLTPLFQVEDEGPAISGPGLRVQLEEVDILGLDGHIYKGRLNTRASKTGEPRLPTISSKEGICKSKDKVIRSHSHKSAGSEPGCGTPLRPQSAKTQRSRSGSASSVRDRPMSSIGCLSQSSLAQSPTQAEAPTSEPQDLALHVDLSQSEDEPATSL